MSVLPQIHTFVCVRNTFPKFSLIFKEVNSISWGNWICWTGLSFFLWSWRGSSNQAWREWRKIVPHLSWPLENSRRVVRVIDNCVWAECSMSVDNDSETSQSSFSSPLQHWDIVFPPLCYLLLAGPGCACPRCLSLPKAASPICNYVVLADNDLPSASTVELILFINMPDGDNWRKVIGQRRCNSLH